MQRRKPANLLSARGLTAASPYLWNLPAGHRRSVELAPVHQSTGLVHQSSAGAVDYRTAPVHHGVVPASGRLVQEMWLLYSTWHICTIYTYHLVRCSAPTASVQPTCVYLVHLNICQLPTLDALIGRMLCKVQIRLTAVAVNVCSWTARTGSPVSCYSTRFSCSSNRTPGLSESSDSSLPAREAGDGVNILYTSGKAASGRF